MDAQAGLNLTSLREQVYEHLKRTITRGELSPGAYLDLTRIARDLGISRTPLRDALIQLESEGFVSILARRGVVVNPLTLNDIRHLYEMIGALEGAVVMSVFERITPERISDMRTLNSRMRRAVRAGDFDTYYDLNLSFHQRFLELSDNRRLLSSVETFKHRLYDFPRRSGFVQAWELASVDEHAAFIDLLANDDPRGAADYLRDVHWSFDVQEPYIQKYYFADDPPTVPDPMEG